MKEKNMNVWMTFDEAWEKFFERLGSKPSSIDKEKARTVVDALGCAEFRPLDEYIRDKSNVVHINKGFLVTKLPAPHVSPDSTYEDQGFVHRLAFTNAGARSGSARETPAPTRLVCGLCLGEDHNTVDCSEHPAKRN